MPAFKKTSGRQQLIIAHTDFDYSQLVSGVFKGLIEVPQSAVIEGGSLVIKTVWNSLTSDVAVVGDAASTARYKASASITALGLQALTPTGFIATTPTNIGVVWTGVGTAPTTGIARLQISYYVLNRSQFGQGPDN